MSKKNGSNILSVLSRTALAFVFVFGQTAWAMQGQNGKDQPGASAAGGHPSSARRDGHRDCGIPQFRRDIRLHPTADGPRTRDWNRSEWLDCSTGPICCCGRGR